MKIIFRKGMLIPVLLLFCSTGAFAATAMSDEERILRYTASALRDMAPLSAGEVYEIVGNNDTDVMIVSLQSEEEYNAGHVPGAVRLAPDLSRPFDLAQKLPEDKTVILVSSNGQEACKAAVFLRQLGYKANPMMLGMHAYNRAYAGTGAYTGDAGQEVSVRDVPFIPQPAQQTCSGTGDQALIAERTLEYARKERPFAITTSDFAALKDNEDVFIISMQSPEDYAAGHIPGAVNIPGPQFIAGDERLLSLPRNKKIIVTCYIGHYSSMGTLILNQMGYEAYSLAWGLAGWNRHALGKKIGEAIAKDAEFAIESTP